MAEDDEKSPSFAMKMTLMAVQKKFYDVKHLPTKTLYDWLSMTEESEKQKKIVLLLDCRPEEEFQVSHIPGAVRVDYKDTDPQKITEILQDVNKSNSKLDAIVCYCSLGYRSSYVARNLQEYYKIRNPISASENVPEIYNLDGCIFKWANEGRPMIDGKNEPTVYAHPFSVVWGKMLARHLRKSVP